MTAPRPARVRVPASAANVGSGYDCIGFAVDRWLAASVVAHDAPGAGGPAVVVRRSGTLATLAVAPAEDALVAGFAAACAARGRPLPARLEFEVHSEIPVARGLGSSSAALVAGASLANEALALGMGDVELAALCTAVEGHPDNVAPAVFGGAVLGVPAGDGDARRWLFSPLDVHPELAFAFVVPSIPVETAAARAVLPLEVTHARAVQAVGRSAALVRGLASGSGALLGAALDDVLHVPYRRHLVPGFDEVVSAARAAGAHGATLSGSGSTMLAVCRQRDVEGVAAAMRLVLERRGVASESFVQRRVATR